MGLTGVPEAVDDGLAQSNGILNGGWEINFNLK
jgi:hypothetical protein